MTNEREEAERGREEEGKREEERERERTKEALCGEQGIESPSETNKNWNNNKSQKALPPLLFLTQPTPLTPTHTHFYRPFVLCQISPRKLGK